MNTWVNRWMSTHGLVLPEGAYKDLCAALNERPEAAMATDGATITVEYHYGQGATMPITGPKLADFVRNVHSIARLFPGGTLGPLKIERPVCVPRFVGPYVHAPKSFDTMEGNRQWSKGLAGWRKAIEADREAWELLR